MSGINPIQGNLLLQGVANASPWLTTEELLAPARQNSLLAREAMQTRQAEQEMRNNEIEYAARAAAGLLSLNDEAAMAAAYPDVVRGGQQYGYLKNAPSVFPGKARLEQIAAMGTPSKDLLEAANVQRALAGSGTTQYQTPPAGTATIAAPAAPGGGFTGDREQDRALIVKQESGGDPTALNYVARNDPTAYARGATASGKYQFVNSTWREGMQLAGLDPNQYPTAREAPEAVQDKVFDAVYAKYGTKPWQKGPQDWVPNEQGQYQLVTVRPPAGTPGGAPVTAVTAQQPPVRGVAARTGGTDVAGPGAGTGGTTTAGGATTAATTQQPPAATTAAPGISPPTPPQPTNGNGLTPAQQQTINTEKALVRTREQANAVLTKEQQYRDANVTAQRQYQADQLAYQNAVLAQRSDVRQETASQIAQRKAQIDEEAAAQARDKAKRDAKFTGAPTGYQWSEDGSTLVQSPGFQGTDKDERLDWRLDHGDPNSAQYAADYAAKKWQVSQAGNVIENDMSMYRPPAQPVQRPTYLPQPTPASLDKVRETTTDANVIVQNIDNYLKVLGETDGATIGAFLSNPRDPKAQKLLGAFDAMKMAMRGPSAMNTGVLQPAEMKMLQDDLVSPQTVRGFTGTPEAAGARLGQIKLSILRRADAELRSVGKDGILVRSAKEYQALPSGAQYYDEDGNRRTKE